jgi:short-subunit dehydrogenase
MAQYKVAWLTGASSGLGEAAARRLAADGTVVCISARSEDKLRAIAADFSNIHVYPADVTDADVLTEIAADIEKTHGPIDLALFCAGTWFPGSIEDMKIHNFHKTFDINVNGVANALAAVLPYMLERKSGHISWISSVAGYGGLPDSMSYGASKSALITMAEGLRPELAAKGIDVTVINPGFVKTELTAKNKFPMPFLMELDEAGDAMMKGLKTRKFEVTFPWQLVWILKFLNILPYPLYFWLVRKATMKS